MSFQFNFSELNNPERRLTDSQLMELREKFLVDSNRRSEFQNEWIPRLPDNKSKMVTTNVSKCQTNKRRKRIRISSDAQIEYDSGALISSSYQNDFKPADLEGMIA